MPRLRPRQTPHPHQREEPPTSWDGLDGLLVNGRDRGAAQRRRIREANSARQDWERWLHNHPPQSA